MPLNLFTLLERRFGDPTGGFSRRDLLMASLAAASGILVSSSHSRAAQGTAGKKIIIIGAGMAGVAAAYELQFLGYEVQVVEARDRLGGRAHTLDRFIKNKTVEAGGEMIGLNHPAWISYADQMGLTLLPIPQDAEADMPIIMGNKRLEAAQAKALWTEMRASLTKI
ncbi:MAG: FAD-dependent oxidoreductase, partial [Planctomycetales bacterium]